MEVIRAGVAYGLVLGRRLHPIAATCTCTCPQELHHSEQEIFFGTKHAVISLADINMAGPQTYADIWQTGTSYIAFPSSYQAAAVLCMHQTLCQSWGPMAVHYPIGIN